MHGFFEMFDNTCRNNPSEIISDARPRDAFEDYSDKNPWKGYGAICLDWKRGDSRFFITPTHLCKLSYMRYARSSETLRHELR